MPIDFTDLEQAPPKGKLSFDDLDPAKAGALDFSDLEPTDTEDDVVHRAFFLPLVKTESGAVEFGTPGFVQDIVAGITAPRDVMEGKRDPEEAALDTAMLMAGSRVIGGALSLKPSPPKPGTAVARVERPTPTGAAPEPVATPPSGQPGAKPIPEATERLGPEIGQYGFEPVEPRPARLEEPLPKHAGNINLDRIDTPDDVKRTIQGTAEVLAKEMDEARRGTISLEETSRLADHLGMTPEQLSKRRKGEAFNAEQAVAARNLLAESATRVMELARKAQGGSDEDLAAFMAAVDQHAMIQQQVAGMTAEAGRTLSSFRIASKAEKTRLEQLKGVVEAAGGRTRAEDLAAMVNSLETPEQVGIFIRKSLAAKTSDMLLEAWINALLSGPRTHVVNIMSNTLTALWSLPETAAAAGIGIMRGGTDRVPLTEAMSRAYGAIEGLKDGVRLAARTLITEEPSDYLGKIEARRQKSIPGPFGQVVRIPGRLLMTEDEFFKAVNYRMALRGLAIRETQKLGLKGKEAAEHIENVLTNPPEEIHLAARKEAAYRTFTNELGDAGKAIQRFANAHPTMKVILPFIRTPVNLVKFAAERTPFGLFMKSVRDDIAAGGAKRDLAVARMALGSGLAATIATLATEGKITGSGPADPQERALWLANNQPYSIKVGDKWVSYARMDPFATIIGPAADFAEIADLIPEGDADEIAARIAMAITQNLVNKTWLSGISQVIEAVGDPVRYGESWIQSLSGTLIPTGVAHIAQTMDPALRDTQGIIDRWKSRIPELSKSVPVRRDIFGEPIIREGAVGPDIMSPFFQKDADKDPIAKMLLDIDFAPSKVRRVIGDVELNARQYDEYQILAGRSFRSSLEAVIKNTPRFNMMPKGIKQEIVERVFRASRDFARNQMMVNHPELAVQAAEKKVEELVTP